MSALKLLRAIEDTNAGRPVPPRGSEARRSGDWRTSFLKMRHLIGLEIRQPESDADFWLEELEALSDAELMYETKVADIDNAILGLKARRRAALAEIAGKLPPECNLPEFLRRDDPAGYLKW